MRHLPLTLCMLLASATAAGAPTSYAEPAVACMLIDAATERLACWDDLGRRIASDALAQAQPRQPHYALREGTAYGYEPALTDDDRRQGVAAKDLVMFRYAGERAGVHQVISGTRDVTLAFTCAMPCDYVTLRAYDRGVLAQTSRMAAQPGMLARQALEDAAAGLLDRHTTTLKGKPVWVWFGDKGIETTPAR